MTKLYMFLYVISTEKDYKSGGGGLCTMHNKKLQKHTDNVAIRQEKEMYLCKMMKIYIKKHKVKMCFI